MKKYKTFIIFLFLVAIWAAFFSSMKFFLWGELKGTLNPSLQSIAGYFSLWGVVAYLVWGAFASTFLKKYYLFIISLMSLLFILFSYVIWFAHHAIFAFVIVFLGFLYWLWNVVKHVLIAVEIKKTGLADTMINAIVWIMFVVFAIVWTILWNLVFEKFWSQGYIVLILMLAASCYASLKLDYDKKTFLSLISKGWKPYYAERKKNLKKALADYIPDLKFVTKTYFWVMLASSLLWSISTVVSQISMETSVEKFNIDASTAAYIFLFSALGAIIWNIVSMKMSQNRWIYWVIFWSLFSLLIMMFPLFSINFTLLSVFACLVWGFFGVSSNLVDAYFVKKIWEDNKKEYGSSTYGLVLSLVIFFMMFLSDSVLELYWTTLLMIILGMMMLSSTLILYIKQK